MTDINRRTALGALAGATGLAAFASTANASTRVWNLTPEDLGWNDETLEYTLPPLPYAYDALEPHIDAQTMQIHHDKHHAGYVRGLNHALTELRNIRNGEGDAALIAHWTKKLSFHGSGHINHTLFWQCLSGTTGGGIPSGKLGKQIERDFGTFEQFAAQFKAAAATVEASGWAWLAWEPLSRQLLVLQVENQQKLLMTGCVPILGVDVWEHAYYLKYQNKRKAYIDAFMKLANWPWANTRYEQITA
jgi:superoxide dismutase, Fe-Mn family